MRVLLIVAVVALAPVAAFAGLGLPNEAADPGFEVGSGWTVDGGGGLLSNHLSYSSLAPYGVPAAPSGGSYCGGVGAPSVNYPGGQLFQIVDESQFPGWNENYDRKIVEVDFSYFQYSLADVPMTLKVFLDYMEDGSYPDDPLAPGYVEYPVATVTNSNSGGWKTASYQVELPTQPRYLSLHFDFQYFNGTAVNIIDNVNLEGLCVPEPAALSLLALGGLVQRRRRR